MYRVIAAYRAIATHRVIADRPPSPTRFPAVRACRPAHRRRGIAVTELAILLPILVTIVFGTIEICTMIRTQERLCVVAYEGARVAMTPEATLTNVTFQKDLLVAENGLQSVTMEVQPSDLSSLQSGQWVRVTTSAPFIDNSIIGGWMFPSMTLTESISVQRP
ncbi:MAG: TadE/TadG family type IV pilus assembly protein [Planctomycetota bacterium]